MTMLQTKAQAALDILNELSAPLTSAIEHVETPHKVGLTLPSNLLAILESLFSAVVAQFTGCLLPVPTPAVSNTTESQATEGSLLLDLAANRATRVMNNPTRAYSIRLARLVAQTPGTTGIENPVGQAMLDVGYTTTKAEVVSLFSGV